VEPLFYIDIRMSKNSLKIPARKIEGVAEVVEHLPSQ
jgi:hypothetical protein